MEKMEIVLDYLFVALLFSTLVLVILFVFWLILNVISEIRDFFKEKKEEKKSLEFTFSTDKMILGQRCLREVDSSNLRKTSETLKTFQDKSPSLNIGGFFSEKEDKQI